MQTGWWGGNTLLIDFPFPAFPDNMGHWVEVLLPVYSTLMDGGWRSHVQGASTHIDRMLLTNVRREQLEVQACFMHHLQRIRLCTGPECVLLIVPILA